MKLGNHNVVKLDTMIKPKPYKLVCQSCGYKKIVKPKSDALNPSDIISICPKCRRFMKRFEVSKIDIVWCFNINHYIEYS
jgi:Zn finger protein HypA/HybF involved in hydrogenase expression